MAWCRPVKVGGTRTRVSQNGTAGLEPAVEPQRLASLAIINPTASQRILEASPLSESGAGDEVIMSIAGHVSRAMLSRYSHVRMEAKRRALEEIAARQRAADENRKEEAERRQQAVVDSIDQEIRNEKSTSVN